jgi:hypothetical protein
MKRQFWNVGIEIYQDGIVKAAVLRSRAARAIPGDGYVQNPGREVFSLWFSDEAEARGAVIEARAMSKRQEAAA